MSATRPSDPARCSDPQTQQELRAAVDVLFEALSHIQASLETASPDQREASYRRFKDALYDRFEHELERRQDAGEPEAAGGRGDGAPGLASANDGAPAERGDTLEKLWPTIAQD